MEANEMQLVEIYLELKKQLAQAEFNGNELVENLLRGKLEGIILGYEISQEAPMDGLVEKYKSYHGSNFDF